MKISRLVLLIIVPVLFLAASKVSLNESFRINDGETFSGSMNTINGKIKIGKNAVVKGECRTVNGSIDVGSNSKVRDLASVNGNIRVGNDALVNGDIQLVNGSVNCEPGVKVAGCVETVNGRIDLERTAVEENLSTCNGNIELSDNTIIGGDIVIKENHGSNWDYRELRIEIDKSVVEGDIINEEPDIAVTVFLTNGSKVKGKIIDAEIIER